MTVERQRDRQKEGRVGEERGMESECGVQDFGGESENQNILIRDI